MIKLLAVSAVTALVLSACGGGDSAPAAPVLKLSFSGVPLNAATEAVAHAAVTHAASDAGDATTVTTLQDALKAAGVAANVTAGVIDGTTLHQIVMARNGGASPDNSLYGTVDPTDWNIVNFALDDMSTPPTDPTQQAALEQFSKDLGTYTQWAFVDKKKTFVVIPIPTCDGDINNNLASKLALAEGVASAISPAIFVGRVTSSEVVGHMGDDCRTPDTYIQNLRVQRVVSDIVTEWNYTINPPVYPTTPMCSATITTNCQIQQ